jgi:hypothetical protein
MRHSHQPLRLRRSKMAFAARSRRVHAIAVCRRIVGCFFHCCVNCSAVLNVGLVVPFDQANIGSAAAM